MRDRTLVLVPDGSPCARAVMNCACTVAVIDEQSPETRRRMRLNSPPIAFVGGILLLAVLLTAIILVIWALGGFGGEGAEGS
jgi:hypothetical protein